MLTAEEIEGLNTALNEATLLGTEVLAEERLAGITFSVLTLPAEGPMPADPRLQLRLSGVTRVVASLRAGTWDDPNAPVEPFALAQLNEVVQRFGSPMYGWEFFEIADQQLSRCVDRFSLDVRLSDGPPAHSLRLFQEDGTAHFLDLLFWFESLEFRSPAGEGVPLAEVIAGGKRWWDAFFKNDPRTTGTGMAPLK